MLSTLELSPQTLDAEAPVRIAVKNLDFSEQELAAIDKHAVECDINLWSRSTYEEAM